MYNANYTYIWKFPMKELSTRRSTALSYRDAKERAKEKVWEGLNQISVAQGLDAWFESMDNFNTRKNYLSGARKLIEIGLVDPTENLQAFSLHNHEATLDRIKGISDWSEATRQARAALYCAFTRFLSRRTEGLIRKATPSREGTTRTFFKVRETVATRAMNQQQWGRFLVELDKINSRDALIAKAHGRS